MPQVQQSRPNMEDCRQLCYSFARATKDEAAIASCGSISYSDNAIYSYATKIAFKIDDHILCLADNRCSDIISTQINCLKNALNDYKFIYLPVNRSRYSADILDIRSATEEYIRELNELSSNPDYFRRKVNKKRFIFVFDQLVEIDNCSTNQENYSIYSDIYQRLRGNRRPAYQIF